MRRWAILLGLAALAACGAPRKIVVDDFAEGRVVDLSITEKLTGSRELLFFSIPRKTRFLEGYVQGVMTDYQDNPIQGVVVRAVASGESRLDEETRSSAFPVTSFDPGVSDTNGFYRIRFTLPIIDGVVDVRGRLIYNPGWEQERETLGKAYEPQMKQSQFRLYYERSRGRITFVEGIRKAIVSPVVGAGGGKAASMPGLKPPGKEASASEPAPGEKKADDDLFKGFGFGP